MTLVEDESRVRIYPFHFINLGDLLPHAKTLIKTNLVLFSSLLFSSLLIFSFVFIAPTPAHAAIEGEECSIWWVDTHVDGWPFVTVNWVDSCPISCFGDVAGDIHTGRVWCDRELPPPNYPGADLGAMCSASDARTVNLIIANTLGETFEMNGNGQIVSGTSFTFTGIPEGIFNLQTQATNDGGSSGWSPVYTAQHDYSAPTTTANIVGLEGENGWYTSPVNVSFNANDTGCFGVSQTAYAINGVPSNYMGVPFTITDDGAYTLQYRSTDGHHPETEKSVNIKIDSLTPTLNFLPDRPQDVSGWWQNALDITILADDATSGLARLEYNLNGVGWVDGDFVRLTDGIYSFDAQATDNAGHITYDGILVQIDSTAPNLEVTLTGEQRETGWFITPPSVILSAGDATSGLAGILYQVDGDSQAVYTAPLQFVREGLYTLQAYAVDYAQHITTRTFQIGYDITPPQTNIALDETENGMTITLNRWDGVSGFALTRMAINGVWQDYHHPVTVTETGEYWVQYFTTDFAGNIEAEKIANFTIAADAIVVVQVPPIENIAPPVIPPNRPPFETADDFPPNRGGGNTNIFITPPTTPPNFVGDNRTSNDGIGRNGTNSNLSVHGDPPNISRLPVIREDETTTNLSDIFPLEAHIPPQSEPMEYVDHPLAFVPTPSTAVVYTAPPQSKPTNSPLDVTMMAMLGVGMAGLGLMKSQTAVAKQKAQIQADASAQAQLASAMAHQSATASTNWATNQTMQASAYQRVVEQVVQSEVNKDYQTAFANFQSQERQRIQRIIDLVLQTTVTINLIPKTGLIQGFIRRSNLSLGTIANYNGQEVIVTHDHFDDNNRNGRASLTYIQANYSHIHLAGALGIVTLDTNDLGAIYNPVNGIMMLHLLNGNSFNVTPTVATIATNYFPDANENCYYSYVPGWNRDDAISSYNTTSNSIIDFVPYPALYVDIVRMTTMSSYHLSPTWGGEAGKGDSGTGLFNSNGELIGVFQTRDARNLTFGDRVGNIGYNLSEDKEASDPVFSNNNFNIIQ